MSEEPFISDDPAQVKPKQETSKRRRARDLDDLGILMTDPRFRRFMWNVLERCGVYRLSFDRDPGVMAFNEGARNLGLMLLADVHKTGMEDYARMLNEARGDNP